MILKRNSALETNVETRRIHGTFVVPLEFDLVVNLKGTSPGGQVDASVVVSYMKSMYFSDFGPVLGGFASILTDGQTDGRTNPVIEMRGRS